ncbi:MAG: PorP/SprF family type IX secretion system membrane protein, partial [Chitinophagaceae bacterium]
RVAGNHRNQWPDFSKVFVTSTVSADLPILRKRLPLSDTWGVGLMASTDQTASGILNTNSFSLTTAYHKALDESGLHQIGIGFQGTWFNKRLDAARLHFEDQLDNFGGWNAGPSRDFVNLRNLSLSFADLSTGIFYNGSSNAQNNFYAGFSLYHLNRPKASFTGDIYYTLNPRYTAHAGGSIPLNDFDRTLYMNMMYSTQAGARNLLSGVAVGFLLNGNDGNDFTLYGGLWTRFNRFSDAIIPYLGAEWGGLRAGLSYDVTISSPLQNQIAGKGGIELSLIYISRKPGYKPIPCPKF